MAKNCVPFGDFDHSGCRTGWGGNSVDRSMEYGVWTKKISISNYIDFRRDPEGEITKILMIFIRI